MLRDVGAVMRFEFVRMLGSFRMLLVFMLYGAATLLTGMFYVTVVRGLEEQAIAMLAQQGAGGAASTIVDLSQLEGYQNLVKQITGGDEAKAQFWLSTPPMVLVSFLLALIVMPWLVSFVAHDVIARDTELRTLRFVRPKSPVESWVLGKFAAHAVLIFGVTVLSGVELFVIGFLKLEHFDTAAGLLGFGQFWLRLVVYEIGFLGVTFALSAFARTSFTALISGSMALFGLWLLQGFSFFKDGDQLQPIGYLSYLSPFAYNGLLWNPTSVPLFQALGVYIAFAVVSLAFTISVLKTRDI